MLLSAGVQVEVCKVKAKDGAVAARPPKRKTSSGKASKGKATNGGRVKTEDRDYGSEQEVDEEDDGLEEGKYESGEEGEGHWEKGGKRVKLGT